MALIACKECQTEVSSTAKACPKCGAKVPRTKWWLWVPVGLFTAFIAFGAIKGNSPEGKEKSRDRMAIELCWGDQKRKSLDSGTQRFVASTCEMMEADFTRKFGVRP